ncbi:MAG: Gfo/Idh/MocA family oxidoreductase [Christensenella sp.]
MSEAITKIAMVGIGARGSGLLKHLLSMHDVTVTGICDIYEDRVEKYTALCAEKTGIKPRGYTNYKDMLTRDDIDAVIIPTPMIAHSKITNAFLNAGKAVATEVGGASSLEECWELVETSEQSGKPCMMLENCCYGRKEMALLNMVRNNVFGELVFCRGGYLHDLRRLLVDEHDNNRHTRIYNYLTRNGDIYPTHGLGPMAKMLNINRGNRMLSLTSTASSALGMNSWIKENRPEEYEMANSRIAEGDVINTVITCAGGEQMVLTHDTTLPRPYSRGGQVQGTKGIWMESSIYPANKIPQEDFKNGMLYIDKTTPLGCSRVVYREKWQSLDSYLPEYEHPLWREYLNERDDTAKAISAGMDYLVLRAFIDSVKNGTTPPVDVYDAASWMAITCLSEQSVANAGNPVAVPDFTNGKWIEPKYNTKSKYSLDKVNEQLFVR